MNNIVIVGFSGAGKSTIGKRLADKLSMAFVDLDIYIEEKYHTAIPLLFQRYGESVFRALESAALEEVITKDNTIIAVGGGTPCFNDNMAIINNHAYSVYLKLGEDELVEHLLHSKKKRPLTNHLSESELHDYVRKTLVVREPFYMQAKRVCSLEEMESIDDVFF